MLHELVHQVKATGVEFHLVQIDCYVEEAQKRNKQVRSDPSYYSSYFTGIDTQVVLAGFFEDYATNTAQ